MDDARLAAACGIYCGGCEHLEVRCTGCGSVEGRPFWTSEMKLEACPLYKCCAIDRGLEHCGMCAELPCAMFLDFHDPTLSPEEAQRSVREREQALRSRREIGTEKWLEDQAKAT